MNFLNSIKSAPALGLAAAIAIAANVAPAPAQFPSNRTIAFSHQGGYVADYFITFPSQTRSLEALGVTLGQRRVFQVPTGVNVTVTQRMSHNRQVYFQRSFRFERSTCLKNVGTVFNPTVTQCS
jgi:hypothetical protein